MKGPDTSNTCFRCHKPGHFIRDCPEITPNRTPTSHPSFLTTSDPVFPTIHCHCGLGLCHIRVSNSLKNPARKYYCCPGKSEKCCGYFKWCDELREDEVRKSKPETNFPDCECGAGVCTVRVQDTEPYKGRAFFACPIKKGDGACNFKQWTDEAGGQNMLVDELNLSCDIDISRENDKASDVDIDISATSDAMHPCAPQPVENETMQNSFGLESTTHSPLNYSVSKVVAKPNNPASPGTFPNLNPITIPEDSSTAPSVILENSSKEVFDASHSLDNQTWSEGPLNDSVNKGTRMSGTILEAYENSARDFQNKLITILESIDPKDHEAMLKEANCTFVALDRLQVDYGLFHLRVTEYIKQAVSLARIEQTVNDDVPSEDPLNQYEVKKSVFDEVFRAYCQTNDTYVASSKRLKTLRKDASYLRELLAELEKELGDYEMKNAKDEDSLDRISKTMSECKVSFREATEALSRYEKKEIERNAAKVAFETARAQLRKSTAHTGHLWRLNTCVSYWNLFVKFVASKVSCMSCCFSYR